jgi:hypothetical protein
MKKEAEKILKHKDLIVEIQRMRNMKAEVIPVKIGPPGTISKLPRQYLSNISGKHEIKRLQKNSRIGACTHTAESADVKVPNIYQGRNNVIRCTNYIYIYMYIYRAVAT